MITVIDYKTKEPVQIEFHNFSAGETFFRINAPEQLSKVSIHWKYDGDHEIFLLMNLCEYLLNHLDVSIIGLVIPYFPHARQDRYTGTGQPFSLKTLIHFLSVLRCPIATLDIHSPVTKVLLKEQDIELMNVGSDIFAENIVEPNCKDTYLVAPDKGALERVRLWAAALNVPYITCEKVRDPNTGAILRYDAPNVDLTGKRLLIVDDICDGGYTFKLAAEALDGADRIELFVTHGIFSKGLEALKGHIDHIYTTDSMPHTDKFNDPEFLTVFKLEDFLVS